MEDMKKFTGQVSTWKQKRRKTLETSVRSKEMDMLNGGLAGKLILFSIPLAFSSILQQLFNSADVAVVGRFAGEQALAAVGSCVALVGIFVNLIVGLSVGPNAALANLIGQKNRGKINSMVHTILTFGAVLGIVLLVIGMLVARRILVASGTPETVLDQALLYIRIYFVGIPFMVAYNFGAAIVRSYGDTRRPMCYLIVSGVLNVILNLLLVIGFHLGVAGVAIATVISNVVSTFLIISHLYRRNDEFSFRFDRMRIDTNELKKVLAIGIPALNFEYFTYDIAGAFAQAAVTFTSQNFGAGNMKRCRKIFWLCLLFGFGFTEILSVIFIVWEDFFVSIYTTSAAVAAYGIIRMDRVCALEGLTATYEVASSCLRGTGKSLEPSVITILGTVVFRLIWLTTIFRMFTTYDMLMNVYVASWLFTGCSMFVVYFFHMRKIDKLLGAR